MLLPTAAGRHWARTATIAVLALCRIARFVALVNPPWHQCPRQGAKAGGLDLHPPLARWGSTHSWLSWPPPFPRPGQSRQQLPLTSETATLASSVPLSAGSSCQPAKKRAVESGGPTLKSQLGHFLSSETFRQVILPHGVSVSPCQAGDKDRLVIRGMIYEKPHRQDSMWFAFPGSKDFITNQNMLFLSSNICILKKSSQRSL